MLSAQAYCPASISLIFKNCSNRNLLKMGSIGVGFTVDKGVKVTVRLANESAILFNQKLIRLPPVETVVNKLALQHIKVQIESELPLACGFGLSGASSLATSFALGKLFSLNMTRLELAQVAHKAELLNFTGLGSVGTQFTGGFLLKVSPGLPFSANMLPFIGEKIYAIIIDKIETPSILKDIDILYKINQAATHALNKIRKKKKISLEEIFDISYDFAKKSTLLSDKKVSSLIEKIRRNGGQATQAMLGNVVVSNKKPNRVEKYQIEKLTITKDRPRLIAKVKIPIIKHQVPNKSLEKQ